MNARSVGGWPDLLHAIVRGVKGHFRSLILTFMHGERDETGC